MVVMIMMMTTMMTTTMMMIISKITTAYSHLLHPRPHALQKSIQATGFQYSQTTRLKRQTANHPLQSLKIPNLINRLRQHVQSPQLIASKFQTHETPAPAEKLRISLGLAAFERNARVFREECSNSLDTVALKRQHFK